MEVHQRLFEKLSSTPTGSDFASTSASGIVPFCAVTADSVTENSLQLVGAFLPSSNDPIEAAQFPPILCSSGISQRTAIDHLQQQQQPPQSSLNNSSNVTATPATSTTATVTTKATPNNNVLDSYYHKSVKVRCLFFFFFRCTVFFLLNNCSFVKTRLLSGLLTNKFVVS